MSPEINPQQSQAVEPTNVVNNNPVPDIQIPSPSMPLNPYDMPKRQFPKLAIIISSAAIVLLIGGGFLAIQLFKSDSSGSSNNSQNKAVASKEVDTQARTDGTLDLSNLVDYRQVIKTQNISAGLNQQVNLSDGISYMVTGIDRNATIDNKYYKPGTGKEFVKVNVVVGNRRNSGSIYLGGSDFKLKNSAGGLQNYKFISESYAPGVLVSTDVESGKQISGFVVFEVDSNETLASIVTSESYSNSSTGEKVTIDSAVSLQ